MALQNDAQNKRFTERRFGIINKRAGSDHLHSPANILKDSLEHEISQRAGFYSQAYHGRRSA